MSSLAQMVEQWTGNPKAADSITVGTVADLETFGGGDDKIFERKLCIISNFCMFMINVLDLAQTCGGHF